LNKILGHFVGNGLLQLLVRQRKKAEGANGGQAEPDAAAARATMEKVKARLRKL